jgi:LPXTG-motif cell wall-anchored protein
MATATTPGRAGPLPAPPPDDHDWPAQAADTIERVVATVRDKTTRPALMVARAVVYGTFAALVGTACLALVIIASIRLLDSYLPDAVFGEDHIWAAYLILGLLLVALGGLLWRRRNAPREDQPPL